MMTKMRKFRPEAVVVLLVVSSLVFFRNLQWYADYFDDVHRNLKREADYFDVPRIMKREDIEVVNDDDPTASNNITYQINPGPLTSVGKTVVEPWTCGYPGIAHQGKETDQRMPLPPQMRPLFNFTTSLQTDLKILFMGDSVTQQLSSYIASLLRVYKTKKILEGSLGHKGGQNVYVTAPLSPSPFHNRSSTGGSGALAFWRVIGMFLEHTHGWAPPNWNNGWNLETTQTLRDYVSNATSSTLTQKTTSRKTTRKKNITLRTDSGEAREYTIGSDESGNFDVFVFRVPFPSWMTIDKVTQETLRETIELAHRIFGFRVVVLVSMHYSNFVEGNAYTRKDIDRKNQELFDFARNWTETHGQDKTNDTSGVHTVYVLDYGRLNDELMEWNARLLGLDTEENNGKDADFADAKILFSTKKLKIVRTVAQVCGEKVLNGTQTCTGNAISTDGIHLCMNTVGPRLAAGLACQLQCVYPPPAAAAVADGWACAQACNDRFMSIKKEIE